MGTSLVGVLIKLNILAKRRPLCNVLQTRDRLIPEKQALPLPSRALHGRRQGGRKDD
jgi:hypothetical protein